MENNLKFNSAICTSRLQSERLLALGLKKETADMVHIYLNQWDGWYVRPLDVDESIHHMEIPAWSLHRLLCLYNCHYLEFMGEEETASDYDIVIEAIERAITGGYFNEKHLEQ